MTSKFGPFVSFIGGSLALGVLLAGIATPGLAVANVLASNAVNLASSVSAELPLINLQSRSTILAKKGDTWTTLASFYNKNRVPVTSDQISDYAKNAVVAVENPGFWTDSGVNVAAAARAAVQNQVAGDTVSGASTITMQLVKNQIQEQAENVGDDAATAAATEQTLTRKLSNMWLALGVTKQYTKDEILTQYLNISFMGGQLYGIEAAANYYFNVSAKNLSLPQAALLAGMLPSPSTLSPDNPDNIPATTVRRNYVLSKMLDQGTITQAQYDEAVATPITVSITPTRQGCALADYNAFFCDYVVATIKSDPTFGATTAERGAMLNRGGLMIYTTLNLDLQEAAYNSSKYWITPGTNPFATASTSVKVGTGEILAMVQNRPYSVTADSSSLTETAINYGADYAYGGSNGFAPGSSFKVFTLLDWLRTGHSLSDTVPSATPMTFKQSEFTNTCGTDALNGPNWVLSNSANWRVNSMTVKLATVRSVNTSYVSMAKQLDICDIQNLAESLGVSRADGKSLDMKLSDIIGSGNVNVSPLNMTNAFAAIANNGVYCTVTPFVKIVSSLTNQEIKLPGTQCSQQLSSDVTAAATNALQATVDPVTGVTATGANPNDGTPLAGKTGTTNEGVQNWIVGYSTAVATATWVGDPLAKASGFDSITTSHGVAGYNLKAKIWHDVVKAADALYPGTAFPTSSDTLVNGTKVTVPDVTGLSVDAAQKVLTNSGFTSTVGSTAASVVGKGLVASTEPSAGSTTTKGSSIVIHASDGSQLTVPNVVGLAKDVAIAQLQSAGFTNIFTQNSVVTDATKVGFVVSQSLAQGSTQAADTQLTLDVGTAS